MLSHTLWILTKKVPGLVFCRAIIQISFNMYSSCDDMKFDYYGPGFGNGTAIANFSVVWSAEGRHGGFVLDNNQDIRVVMYKCELLATNCGLCLVLSGEKYDCGWCPGEKQCTRQENCPFTSAMEWLDRYAV